MALLTFTAECDRKLVASEVSSQRMIEWSMTVSNAVSPQRSALSLALIIDRSGSMQGDKLRYVQQAACHVLDMLNERDRIVLVAYDDQIQLIAASTAVTDRARNELKGRINALQPGGWTDLAGGWLEGCRALAAQQLAGNIDRALLLTDGLANRGITDSEELTHHARELRQRGIATSTFGVGLDFNEHLLEALATHGGGHFFYIEQPDKIPDVFRQELGELLTVAAREAFVILTVPRGVALELLGDLPHERSGDQIRVYLGDLCAGQHRYLYTQVLTPPDAAGTSVVVRGELCYADLEQRTATIPVEVAFNYIREAEVRVLPVNDAVLQRASEVQLATAAARALVLEREGQREQAQAVLRHTLAATAAYAPAPAAAHYANLSEQVAQGLAEPERKSAQFKAYRKRQSRS